MAKRILAALLAFFLVIGGLPTAFATGTGVVPAFSDMPDDWSTEALQNAVSNGLLNGENGKIMPSANLTRAQMATVIVRAFGATVKGDLSGFSDVKASDWFADSMAKAFQMGVIMGTSGKMNPNNPITRQEVFVILSRALKLQPASTLTKTISDANQISGWAKEEVYAFVNAGYAQGTDGKLNPLGFITRAEFAKIFDSIIKQYIREAGVVTEVATGNVMVNVPGVTLKNLTVKGDLIIGDGVGDGEMILDGVKITGRMVVRGGGVNSIIIKGNSSVSNVIVSRTDGKVSVKVEGDADVEVIYVDDGADDVFVQGKVGNIEVKATDVVVTAVGATIGSVEISGANSKVVVDTKSKVETVNVQTGASNAKIEVAGTVTSVKTQAADTSVSGAGTVTKVEAQSGSTGAKIETPKTQIVVSDDATGVTGGGGKTIDPGTTATNNSTGDNIVTPTVNYTPGIDVTNVSVVSALTVEFNCDVAGATIKWNGALVKNGADNQLTVAGKNTVAVQVVLLGSNNSLTVEKSNYLSFTKSDIKVVEYYTGAGFTRSSAPIVEDDGSVIQAINSNKALLISVDSSAYIDSGVVMKVGTLGDLGGITVDGSGSYGLNLFFDLYEVGEFFEWNNDDTFAGVGGDTYALCSGPFGDETVIDESTVFNLMGSDGGPNTLHKLKEKYSPETPVGIWVGVTSPTGAEAHAAINSVTVSGAHETVVDDADALKTAIANADPGDTIYICGEIGSVSDYSIYEIDKPITIKGLLTASIYGTFHVYADGVSFDGLKIYNKGGFAGSQAQKAAIDVLAKQISITNCDFIMGHDVPADYVANGVTIWPMGTEEFSLTMSGNRFTGYNDDSDAWSSCAVQIVENISIATERFTKADDIYGDDPTTGTIDISVDALQVIAEANEYSQCSNDFIYQDWAKAGEDKQYKFVYATNEQALLNGLGYTNDGATVLLAQETYELTEQINIARPIALIGLGNVTLRATGTWPDSSDPNFNSKKHLLGVYPETSGGHETHIAGISFDSNDKAYGIQVYGTSSADPVDPYDVSLDEVNIINSKGAGLTVNGARVSLTNSSMSGNAWGSVNVDPGSGVSTPSEFTLDVYTELLDAIQVWSDGTNVTGPATVTVNVDDSVYTECEISGLTYRYWTTRPVILSPDDGDDEVYPTIQMAINAAEVGDTVIVPAGTYRESVVVNKAITLESQDGPENTIIVAPNGNADTLRFGANDATVRGFTLTHNYTEAELAAWSFNNKGVDFGQTFTGNTLTECIVTLNRNGIYLNNCTGNKIQNNIIVNNRTGINMTNTVNGTEITNNMISDNWTVGLVYYDQTPRNEALKTDFSTLNIEGNTFDGNWYSEILIKDAIVSEGTLNVSDNTFTDSPVTYTMLDNVAGSGFNEPGFAELKPVGLGDGTATAPTAAIPTLRIYKSVGVTLRYDDISIRAGATLTVGGSGTYPTIQDAVGAAADYDMIVLAAGTYDLTNDAFAKSLSFVGVGDDTVLNSQVTQSVAIGDRVLSFKDLKILGPIHVNHPDSYAYTLRFDNITFESSATTLNYILGIYNPKELEVKNSRFNAPNTEKQAAINVHNSEGVPDSKAIITGNTFDFSDVSATNVRGVQTENIKMAVITGNIFTGNSAAVGNVVKAFQVAGSSMPSCTIEIRGNTIYYAEVGIMLHSSLIANATHNEDIVSGNEFIGCTTNVLDARPV